MRGPDFSPGLIARSRQFSEWTSPLGESASVMKPGRTSGPASEAIPYNLHKHRCVACAFPLSHRLHSHSLPPVSYRDLQKRVAAPGFFWTPPDHVTETTVTIFGDEARHAVSVCRLGIGEMITVCDGDGNAYDGEIEMASSREVRAKIVRAHRQLGEPSSHVTLAAGVGKPQNFDWIVEKSVELGVAKIIPVRGMQSPSGIGGSEAAARRVERWRRLALGAMKQSLRSRRPPIQDITAVDGVVRAIQDHQVAVIADPGGRRLDLTAQAINRITKVLVIVGPESGFTTDERDHLVEHGALPFNLGERRLRAETAAVTALALVMHQLEEL